MRSSPLPRMMRAALPLLAAAVALTAYFALSRQHPTEASPAAPSALAPSSSAAARPENSRTALEEPKKPAEAAPGKLEAMSPTFRNSTFLIAIRKAGFVCDDVAAANATGPHVWVASCKDLNGYEISVDDDGRLVPRPIVHYFDGLTPSPFPPTDRVIPESELPRR